MHDVQMELDPKLGETVFLEWLPNVPAKLTSIAADSFEVTWQQGDKKSVGTFGWTSLTEVEWQTLLTDMTVRRTAFLYVPRDVSGSN